MREFYITKLMKIIDQMQISKEHEDLSAPTVTKKTMSQTWIFLTVGFGLSLLVGVVLTVLVLCCLVMQNKRKEQR